MIQIFEEFASLSFQVSSYEVKRSQRYLLATIENYWLEAPIQTRINTFPQQLKDLTKNNYDLGVGEENKKGKDQQVRKDPWKSGLLEFVRPAKYGVKWSLDFPSDLE